jgi:hypothetical protein
MRPETWLDDNVLSTFLAHRYYIKGLNGPYYVVLINGYTLLLWGSLEPFSLGGELQ